MSILPSIYFFTVLLFYPMCFFFAAHVGVVQLRRDVGLNLRSTSRELESLQGTYSNALARTPWRTHFVSSQCVILIILYFLSSEIRNG